MINVNANVMTGSNTPKPEKADNEIEILAGQIRNINEKKMVQINGIQNYIPLKPAAITASTEDIISEDCTSVQGQFGWLELDKAIIPYLIRSGRKFVSIRMADMKLLFPYKHRFSDDIHECYKLDKVQVTNAEVQLLNEINFGHCDRFYGSALFTLEDCLVLLEDIKEMLEFFKFCESRLIKRDIGGEERCGFLRIDSTNCVPYARFENKQYVALFYFEGECQHLEKTCIDLKQWELAYLKFAFTVQGIKKSLFDKETMKVVDLELVKKYFHPDTTFEEFWPLDSKIDHLIRKPIQNVFDVPPQTLNGTRENVQIHKNINTMIKKNRPKKILPVQPKKKAQIKTYATLQKITSVLEAPQLLNFSTRDFTSSSPMSNNQVQMNSTNNGVINKQNTLLNQCVRTFSLAQSSPFNRQPDNFRNINKTGNDSYNPVFTPQTKPSSNTDCATYYEIADTPQCCEEGSYVLWTYHIENKDLNYCINLEPFNSTVLLVPLEEIASVFRIPVEAVHRAINAMRLDVYVPNKRQMALLQLYGIPTTKGLLRITNFVDNLPQIKYILESAE